MAGSTRSDVFASAILGVSYRAVAHGEQRNRRSSNFDASANTKDSPSAAARGAAMFARHRRDPEGPQRVPERRYWTLRNWQTSRFRTRTGSGAPANV
jgi:hypothetical protein